MTVKANLFPGGVRRALTMSYDDGQIFDVRLAELFDKYHIRGTFHINSGNLGGDKYVKKEDFARISGTKPSFFLGQLHKGHHIRVPGGIAKEHLQCL